MECDGCSIRVVEGREEEEKMVSLYESKGLFALAKPLNTWNKLLSKYEEDGSWLLGGGIPLCCAGYCAGYFSGGRIKVGYLKRKVVRIFLLVNQPLPSHLNQSGSFLPLEL